MDSLPEDLIVKIYNYLDDFSKYQFLYVNKLFNNIFCNEKKTLLNKLLNFENEKRNNFKRLNVILNRNFFVDDHVIHGECELCFKKGFLRYISLSSYDGVERELCVCLDSLSPCMHVQYLSYLKRRMYSLNL